MYVAISGHKVLTWYKSNVRFIELKALLAPVLMNPCVASSSKRSTTAWTVTLHPDSKPVGPVTSSV